MDVYARLDRLGIELPSPPRPIATYETHAGTGRILFVSGQGPIDAAGRLHTGTVGNDVPLAQARAHARLVAINLIAVLHYATGDLNRVNRIVRLFGMINAVPDFTEHAAVLDGCTDLLTAVFGPAGAATATAVGLGALPGRITVEIEAVAEIAGDAEPPFAATTTDLGAALP